MTPLSRPELGPYLNGQVQTETFSDALEAALAIGFEMDRAEALTKLAPYLSGEILQNALEAVFAIRSEKAKAQALAAFLPYITDSPSLVCKIYKIMVNYIWKDLPTRRRQDVLTFLNEEALFQPQILDQKTLDTIAQSINRVCFEWRWL